MADQPRTVVYLVHGTWAHGLFRFPLPFSSESPRLWFEPGSPFLAHLQELAGSAVGFVPFLWSGANTVRARHEAARRLAAQLREDMQREPAVSRLIIAHSHGGNVALHAVGMLGRPIPIATMGTPFLSVRERAVTRNEADALILGRLAVALLPVLALFIVALVVLIAVQEVSGIPMWPLLIVAAMPWLLRWWRRRRRYARLRARYERADRPLGEGVAEAFSFYRTRGMVKRDRLRRFVFRATRPMKGPEVEVLALRMPRDEASLGLRLAGLFATVTGAVWGIVDTVVQADFRLARRLGLGQFTVRKRILAVGSMLLALATLFGMVTLFPEHRWLAVLVAVPIAFSLAAT